MNRKIAVLIADSYASPFPEIKSEVHSDIWAFAEDHGIEIFYMLGSPPTRIQRFLVSFSDKIRYSNFWIFQRCLDIVQLGIFNFKLPKVHLMDNMLLVDIPEGLRYLGVKLLASLQYLKDQNFDLVYKTTLSSLVNPDLFLSLVNNISLEEPVYAGTIVSFPRKTFVSGANLLLNKKAMDHVLKNKCLWNHGDLDDVAISNLLKNVNITSVTSLNVSKVSEVEDISTLELASITHYRCRTAGPTRTDIEVMKSLHQRIKNLK